MESPTLAGLAGVLWVRHVGMGAACSAPQHCAMEYSVSRAGEGGWRELHAALEGPGIHAQVQERRVEGRQGHCIGTR